MKAGTTRFVNSIRLTSRAPFFEKILVEEICVVKENKSNGELYLDWEPYYGRGKKSKTPEGYFKATGEKR